jgi:hypothetical protein
MAVSPPALDHRVAAVAVTVLFVVNGMLLGGYGASLPSLRDKVGIGATQIAILLSVPAPRPSLRCRPGGLALAPSLHRHG